MNLSEIGTLRAVDAESGDELVAIVRGDAQNVALCLSVEKNGDVEAVFAPADAKKLVALLQQALAAPSAQRGR